MLAPMPITNSLSCCFPFKMLYRHFEFEQTMGGESSSPQFLGYKETNITETSRSLYLTNKKISNWLVISLFLNHLDKICVETETYSWLIFMVHEGKYTIHGCSGLGFDWVTTCFNHSSRPSTDPIHWPVSDSW